MMGLINCIRCGNPTTPIKGMENSYLSKVCSECVTPQEFKRIDQELTSKLMKVQYLVA